LKTLAIPLRAAERREPDTLDQLPNLGREQEMLESMGMKSIDELFSNIPAAIRRDGPLPLREPQTEEEI